MSSVNLRHSCFLTQTKLVAFSCHFSLKVSETALNTWQLFLKMDAHYTFVTNTYENLT